MTSIADKKLLLVGAGKMGGALLAAWLRAGVKPESVTVVEPGVPQTEALGASGVTVVSSLENAEQVPDCVILAVKPQSMDALLPALAAKFGGENSSPRREKVGRGGGLAPLSYLGHSK